MKKLLAAIALGWVLVGTAHAHWVVKTNSITYMDSNSWLKYAVPQDYPSGWTFEHPDRQTCLLFAQKKFSAEVVNTAQRVSDLNGGKYTFIYTSSFPEIKMLRQDGTTTDLWTKKVYRCVEEN